jgi:hypothetical protein
MNDLKIDELVRDMLAAAGNSLQDKWPALRDLAANSFRFLVQNLADIRKLKDQGKITEEQARIMLDMQRDAIKMMFLTEKGLTVLAAEAAVNAALGAVGKTINSLIGWKLL